MHKSHSWSRFTYWSNFASSPFRGFLLLMAFTQPCSPLSNRLAALMSQLILNEWLKLFVARFWISTEVVRCWLLHGWHYLKLLPPRRVLCVPYIPPCHVTSCKATYTWCMRDRLYPPTCTFGRMTSTLLCHHFIVHLGNFKQYPLISMYFILFPIERLGKWNYFKLTLQMDLFY